MNANEISEWIVSFLILAGAILGFLAALGVVRFPDIYSRSHASTKSATLGVLCILVGAFIFFGVTAEDYNARLLLGIVFVFITAPVGGHLITRAAYHSKVDLWEQSVQDELKKSRSIE